MEDQKTQVHFLVPILSSSQPVTPAPRDPTPFPGFCGNRHTHSHGGKGRRAHTHTHSKNGIYLIKYTLSISKGKALDEWCMKGHYNSVFSLEELTGGSVGWFGR